MAPYTPPGLSQSADWPCPILHNNCIISISVRDHRSREGKQLVQSASWSVTELDFENPD